MLDTVFYFILNMSIASCFVIAVLLLIRQIRPLPRRVIYPLWVLAFFRLVMPFTFPTGWSLFNFTGGLVKRLITVETITQRMVPLPEANVPLTMNMIGAAVQYAPIEYKTESLRQVFTTASAIWAIIAAAMILTAVILYILTQKELKNALPIKDNLYRSDMLLSPLLTGLLRPKIILPFSLDPDSPEGSMVIAHENVHTRRWDNLWRLLGIAITCLHWFNPFAWIMLKAFFTDMEQSCDEAVIKKYRAEERKAYAGAILRFAEDKRLLISTAFGRSGVKVRIVNVLNYKKLTLAGAVASALFLLVVAVVLITNPQLRG
jgi:beta-lactamase regulating signal transducer with metallopeptidase domain